MTAADSEISREFGPQRATFEAPDLLVLTFSAPMYVDDFRAILVFINDLVEERGPIFLLMDLRGVKEIPRSIRSFTSTASPKRPYLGGAFVIEGFSLRIALQTLIRASRFLFPLTSAFNYTFCATEDEARAWNAVRRAEAS
jgi:hypothetical protein